MTVKVAHAKGRRIIALAAQPREDRVRARRAHGPAEGPTARLQLSHGSCLNLSGDGTSSVQTVMVVTLPVPLRCWLLSHKYWAFRSSIGLSKLELQPRLALLQFI